MLKAHGRKRLTGFLVTGLALALGARAADEGLAGALAQAPRLEVETLCSPYSDVRGGDTMWFRKPDGSGWTLLVRYYKTYNEDITFVMIDPVSGAINQRHYKTGFYAIQIEGTDGKGYGNTSEGVMVYDPAANDLALLPGSPVVGGETKPMVIGPDGVIYGTGSANHRAVAYAIDPKASTFTDYGEIGPSHAPNPCWGYAVAADATHVYVVSGKLPWYLVAYDRAAKRDEVLLTLEDPNGIIMLGQERDVVVASVRHSGGKPEDHYWVVGGKATPKGAGSTPPAGSPAAVAPSVGHTKPMLTGSTKPDAAGNVAFEVALADGVKRIAYTIPVYSANIYQVLGLPDGRICGVGGNYLGPFIYDPVRNDCERLGSMGGSVPVMAVLDGLIYMSGYPRAATCAYDPTRPPGDGNPRQLGPIGNAGSGIHTPFAMVTGADGRVYLGGGWHRNGEGGGLGWWDPKSQSAGGTAEGLGNYRVTHMATTGNGRYVVLSTKAVFDQERQLPAPKQAKLFVYDTAEQRMINAFETIPGAEHTGAIADGGGTRVVALTLAPEPADQPWHQRGSMLYACDVLTGKMEWTKSFSHPIGFVVNENFDNTVPFDFIRGPDGMLWTFMGGEMRSVNPAKDWGLCLEDARLVRVNQADGVVNVVGYVGTAGRLAFSGRDLYLSGGSKYHISGADSLRRIRNVLP